MIKPMLRAVCTGLLAAAVAGLPAHLPAQTKDQYRGNKSGREEKREITRLSAPENYWPAIAKELTTMPPLLPRCDGATARRVRRRGLGRGGLFSPLPFVQLHRPCFQRRHQL